MTPEQEKDSKERIKKAQQTLKDLEVDIGVKLQYVSVEGKIGYYNTLLIAEYVDKKKYDDIKTPA